MDLSMGVLRYELLHCRRAQSRTLIWGNFSPHCCSVLPFIELFRGLSSLGTKDSRDFIIKYTNTLQGTLLWKKFPSSCHHLAIIPMFQFLVTWYFQWNSHELNQNTGQTSLIQVSSTVQAAFSKPFRFANSAPIPDELWFNLCETTLWNFC